MAYTIVPTITTGDVATAAWGNTYIKDNFAAGVPDIFTADGEVAIGTGANASESVAILQANNYLKRAYGGLEVALADPDADRILFWDDSAGAYAYLTAGDNLTITATTMTADVPGITSNLVSGTRTASAGAGTQNVTGAGFTPRDLTIFACDTSVALAAASWGLLDDDSDEFCLRRAASGYFDIDGTNLVDVTDGVSKAMVGVGTLTSDGVDIVWTKHGAGLNIEFIICFRK